LRLFDSLDVYTHFVAGPEEEETGGRYFVRNLEWRYLPGKDGIEKFGALAGIYTADRDVAACFCDTAAVCDVAAYSCDVGLVVQIVSSPPCRGVWLLRGG
jgi:hypothetical protein